MHTELSILRNSSRPAKRRAWEELQRELQKLSRPGVGRVVDHIEYAVQKVGMEHVGIGTDYDGIELTASGLEDISHFPLLWEEMRRRGFSKNDISKVAGGNLLRVMRDVRR